MLCKGQGRTRQPVGGVGMVGVSVSVIGNGKEKNYSEGRRGKADRAGGKEVKDDATYLKIGSLFGGRVHDAKWNDAFCSF